MKLNFLRKKAMLGAALFLSQIAFVAHAQPDLNVLPKGDNPAPRERPDRAARQLKLADEVIRNMLVQGGVKDVATQDAVLSYVKEDTEARRPMRDLGIKLFQALRAEGVTEEQMQALIADYRAAQEAEKIRREEAQEALDAKIHFTQNPRLEAMLLLAGLIGAGDSFMLGTYMRGGQTALAEGQNAEKRAEYRKRMIEMYDKNANGQLEADERRLMREDRKAQRDQGAKQPVVAPQEAPGPAAEAVIANELNA